jgi:hypothetical protein
MNNQLKSASESVQAAANKVIEHFDGCIILGSTTDDDGDTVFVREVRGNRHAVEGAVREWLRTLDHYEAGYHAEKGRQDAVAHRDQDDD